MRTRFDSGEHADQQLPRRFAWMPSLRAVLRGQHADNLTRQMLARLWSGTLPWDRDVRVRDS